MVLDPLTLLLGLLSFLLGYFVLLFGLLFGLLHLLQRKLFLLLGLVLIVVTIGGKAAVADQARWGLGVLRAEGAAGRGRQVNCLICEPHRSRLEHGCCGTRARRVE